LNVDSVKHSLVHLGSEFQIRGAAELKGAAEFFSYCWRAERQVTLCQTRTVVHVKLLYLRAAPLSTTAGECSVPHLSGQQLLSRCARAPVASAIQCARHLHVTDTGEALARTRQF